LSKPTGLKFILPKSVPEKLRQETPLTGALTLLIADEKKIFYYEGDDPKQMHPIEVNGVRQVIIDKKKRTGPEKFMVIIKPGKDSNFQTLIHVMDEMNINDVKRYALVDPDPEEINLMHQN
jgi:biopolymer transport protein ExbD